jgi:hypothetical protein
MEIHATAVARELSSVAGACLLAIGMAGPMALRCQALPAQPLVFEVASVKRHPLPGIMGMLPGMRPVPFMSSGSRFMDYGVTIQQIIMQAFDFKDYQVLGLPNWAKLVWAKSGGEYYDIDARCPSDTQTNTELREMLQSLLAERFQLRFHRETKELPVYALIIAKGGVKSQEVPGGGTTVYRLLQNLSMFLDRPIVDHTDLPGQYAFAQLPGLNRAREDPMTAVSEISAILEDRVGLKLEPRKESASVLMVDHVERPSSN